MVCTPAASKILACIVLGLALVLTSYYALASASRGKIGVDYGLNGDNLPSPKETVELLCSRGIRRVRIYEARPDVIQAFAFSGIDLMIGVPNEDVPKLAANVVEAFNWVTEYVLPFPTSGISAILVGNEWLSNSSNDPSVLVPAMQNIYNALSTLQLFDFYLSGIKVSTSHAFDVLSNPSFPPSTATFTERVVAVMRPLLDFLENTRSFLMVNIFPYFAYIADEGVSLKFALFESTEPVMDPNTGLNYTNLFDLQLDAVYAAMASLLSSSPSLSPSPLPSPCGCNSSEIEKASKEGVHAEAATRQSPSPPNRKSPSSASNVHLKTGETGWPSGSGSHGTPPGGMHGRHFTSALSSTKAAPEEEVKFARCECEAATVENARTYNQNLIRHVLQAKGTPAHPTTPIEAYIFELFNEDLKPPGIEQNFGLFFPNGTAVYPINFHDRGL